MTKAKTYSEKLQHPKWQRKRLHILSRDNFSCTLCGDKENTLHIHHMKYEKGKMPWDYEDSVFKTVCKDCHLIYEDFKGTDYLLLKSTTTRTINCMKIVAVHVETDDDDKKLEFIYLFSINREDQTCEVYHILHFSEIETINEMISLGRVRNVG